MKLEPAYVDSLEEFIRAVRNLCRKWGFELWFRGLSSSRYPLRPSLYKAPHKTEAAARREEDEARIEFSRRGHALILEREPRTDLDWYVLMRHNGVPTRLLDWSEGSLIALYFALRPYALGGLPPKGQNAAVWVIDPQWLNGKAIGRSEFLTPSSPQIKRYLPEPRSRKRRGLPPVAVLPTYLMQQMLTQRSAFTIQGGPGAFERIMSSRGANRVAKIVVRRSAFDEILSDLPSCGITESTVFPNLGGVGREVTEFFL